MIYINSRLFLKNYKIIIKGIQSNQKNQLQNRPLGQVGQTGPLDEYRSKSIADPLTLGHQKDSTTISSNLNFCQIFIQGDLFSIDTIKVVLYNLNGRIIMLLIIVFLYIMLIIQTKKNCIQQNNVNTNNLYSIGCIIVQKSLQQSIAIQETIDFVEMDQNRQKYQSAKIKIMGYVAQIITTILIIIYCIFSASILSSINLLFILGAAAVNICKIYYVKLREQRQSVLLSKQTKIQAYAHSRVIWIIVTGSNILFFILKIVVLATKSVQLLPNDQQEFFQVQNLAYMFVPTIIIPFAGMAAFSYSSTKNLNYYKKSMNESLKAPTYFVLGVFAVLIQIFTQSIVSIIYFIIALMIFTLQDVSWINIKYRIIVTLMQSMSGLVIILSFLTSTSFFNSFNCNQYFKMAGLDGLFNTISNPYSIAHFVTQIILFLYCCVLQRFFQHQRLYQIAIQNIQNFSIAQSKIFGTVISAKQIQIADLSPTKMLRQSLLKQKRGITAFQKGKSYELQNYKQQRGNSLPIQDQSSVTSKRHCLTNYEHQTLLKLHQQNKSKRSLSHYSSKPVPVIVQKPSKSLIQIMLKIMNSIIRLLNSPDFTLRVVELISIIIIQRHNNAYSFVALLWLAFVATVQNLKAVYLVTAFIIMPLEIGNYIVLLVYNMPHSPFDNVRGYSIWGLQLMYQVWLDVLLFNIYLYYIIFFVSEASKSTRTSTYKKSKKIPEPTKFVLIVAFIFRYTYLFTIAGLFFLGFSTVTLFNLVYVLLFFVFFTFGENLTLEKKVIKKKALQGDKVKKQIRIYLTTLSRKFWFVIVYYTLMCILIKYIYFLFFKHDKTYGLDPTGINQVYQWSFNFSLTSVCNSNTTPLFIIFVLAQIQIMIHRSSIYLNYSFSLIATTNQMRLKSKKNLKKQSLIDQLRKIFSKIIVFSLQSYYQGLYYISGIIILACTYRWNIIQIPIVILTCLGMLRKFNKTILRTIVLVDLIYIFLNYIVRFINYQSVSSLFGPYSTDIITKIAMFCGFIIDPNQLLQSILALNVVIFYFSVESLRLCDLLEQKRLQNRSSLNQPQQRHKKSFSLYSIKSKKIRQSNPLTQYQPTVINSEYDKQTFAQKYQTGVIQVVRRYYNTNMINKYPWLKYFCKGLSVMIVDLVFILVLLCCLYFRLSVTMLAFLIVYLIFYFCLFDQIGCYLIKVNYMNKVQDYMDQYNSCQKQLQQRQKPMRIHNNNQKLQDLKQFINQTDMKILSQKAQWKKTIWLYSTVLSVICLTLTYACQFLISQFYEKQVNFAYQDQLQNILFIIGVSVSTQTTFFNQVYFYYFMVLVNLIQKLLIQFTERQNQLIQQQVEMKNSMKKQNYNQIRKVQNTSLLIRHDLENTFIKKCIIFEDLKVLEDDQIDQEDEIPLDDEKYEQQIIATTNLLIYFNFKQTQVRTNILCGLLSTIVRIYLWLLLINVYEKSNLTAFFYLAAIFYFWFRKMKFQVVKDINKAAVVILIAQYILLLLDIQQFTSPLPLPNADNLSFLKYVISDKQWLNFLVLSQDKNFASIIFVSFFTNAIVMFLTEVYFFGIQHVNKTCMKLIQKVWTRYQYINKMLNKMQSNQRFDLNFQKYKSLSFRVFTFIYQTFIINSYVLVAIIVLLVVSDIHNYIALGLLLVMFFYIYFGLYTKYGVDQNIFPFTQLFFKVFRTLLFAIITISLILNIPLVENYLNNKQSLIGLDINLSDIFSLLFLQLWLDLTKSSQFYRVTVQGLITMKKKQQVRLKCLAYQQNNYLIQSLVKTYQYMLTFDIKIQQAKKIIQSWDKSFKDQQQTDQHQQNKILFRQSHIQEQQQVQPVNQIKEKLKIQLKKEKQEEKKIQEKFIQFFKRNTSNSLSFSYFQIMQNIVHNNRKVLHKLFRQQAIHVHIWDYIIQDYTRLQEQIRQSHQQLLAIAQKIEKEDEQLRIDLLQLIKQQQYDKFDIVDQDETDKNQVIYKVITPQKINLIVAQEKYKKPFQQYLLYWSLSNFNYFMLIMFCIYYLLNPALLSLPLVFYVFAYDLLSDKKLNQLVLFYLFLNIVLGELFQLDFFQSSIWTKYIFYQQNDGTYDFNIGYLFFLFVLVFINQQIKKYQGNKLKQASQAQNIQISIFRILINESKDSPMYLWKMQISDEKQYERNCNPLVYAFDKIQFEIQNTFQKSKKNFKSYFYGQKIGFDLYPYIATVQIFLMLYLIFFYPLMTLVNKSALQQSYKYFTFSGNMIISILAHVISIVIERKITLLSSKNKHKQLIKYIFTMILLVLFLLFIYYWAPYLAPISYQPQPALLGFSFFYFIYFYLSALQVKLGYKKFKQINSFMVKRTAFNLYFMKIFVAIPFLYQIKCIMDWTFIKTSLQVFDWFKLFSIYVSSFKAKMTYKDVVQSDLGKPLQWTGKIIGFIGIVILLLIIFGPMILFSGLNPASATNLVLGGSFQLGIHIVGGNYFNLYQTSHFSAPPNQVTLDQYSFLGLSDVPELQGMNQYDLKRQLQIINFQSSADDFWGISPPNFLSLKESLNQTLYEMRNKLKVNNQFKLTINYLLNREISLTTTTTTMFQYPTNDKGLDLSLLTQLNATFHVCNTSTTIPKMYNSLIRLITTGTAYKPTPIFFTDSNGQNPYLDSVILTMVCVDNQAATDPINTNDIYWKATLSDSNQGIQMYVYSDLYQSLLGGLSFTAIYTSIILVVAGFIRGFLAGNLPLIPYQMNAKPDKILQICQAISILRDRQQYRDQFNMYYELIDVIRSPEVIRKLGSSYSKIIEKERKIRILKEKVKQQKQKRKIL